MSKRIQLDVNIVEIIIVISEAIVVEVVVAAVVNVVMVLAMVVLVVVEGLSLFLIIVAASRINEGIESEAATIITIFRNSKKHFTEYLGYNLASKVAAEARRDEVLRPSIHIWGRR